MLQTMLISGSIRVLYHVFNRVPTAIIRSHLEKHKGHYYGTFKSIMEVLKTAAHDRNVLQVDLMLSSGSVDFSRVNPTKVPFKLLKSKRIVSGCDVSCNLLKEEVAHVHELLGTCVHAALFLTFVPRCSANALVYR